MVSLPKSFAIASALALLVPATAVAQFQTRAYAPENLRTLSQNDQVRVISQEYSEQSRGRRIPDDQLRFYLDQVNRSNWNFSQIKSDIARSLTGNGGVGPGPGPGTQAIRCESQGNRTQTCPTPWQGQSRLVRQLSSNDCRRGYSWDSRNGQVWVNHGCRGEFARFASNYSVTCSSHGSRPTTCAWDRNQGMPYLQQQLSNSPCMQGRNWGYNARQGLWVSGGCRARFGAQ
ncbi:DUF3011 domain-containing protein [Solilutibacter silvestris]|uniref:DUF3011 domain-containing protein n=1 Tax=Solilutibacter silvestris TaxID=1645665 RepID=A0A2K1Q2R8_9GAMM|nr:DUF3011 domain-containing protein [Lysobacter silvestris]PNS09340.1 hypothetical protein Lysil_0969 [Lysobacter silvestris]